MKKLINLVALAALLFIPWQAKAQSTLTVCNGTETNNHVPFYGYYADETQRNQMIFPASMLTDMVNMQITSMTFYVDELGYGQGVSGLGNWIVSLGTTTETTLSGINTTVPLTEVYNGALTFNSTTTMLTVTFDGEFIYTGDNLLVEFNHPVSSGYQNITFTGVTATGASYCYDDQQDFLPKTTFEYTTPSSCARPTALTASDYTSSGMTLSWTDNANTGASYTIGYWKAGGDTSYVTSPTTSYTISGLDANTLYNFFVVANCSGNETSSAINGSFSTLCGGSTCDLTVSTGASYASPYYTPTVTLYQNGVNIGSVTGSTQTVSVCSTDPVDVVYARASLNYLPTVTVIDGGGTTVFSGSTTDNVTGDTLITLTTPCPTCIPPANLTVDSATTSAVTLSWTSRSGASQFVVLIGDSIVNSNVSDTFYTFTDLSTNTLYSFGVQSVCSVNDSSSIAHLSARTSCGAMQLPIYVDFEDAAFNGAWYPCWDSTIHAGTDPSVNDQPGGSDNPTQHTPGGTYAMFLQANSSEHYNLVVGPEMEAIGDAINVSFWARLNSGWIKAGVITNPRDTNTFIPLVTVTETGAWNEYEFNTSTLDATANYRIAWLAYGNGYIGKFDDVNITEYTGCARPQTAYAPDSITAHTAHLAWSPVPGVSGYVVTYGTVNDATSADNISVNVTDTTYTITGLDGQTTYYAWVTSNCGGSTSDVRPFNSFQTAISCPMVTGLTVDSITTDGATIRWTAGGTETEWLVAVDSNDYETVNVNTYTITGLDAMTGHTVHVRANCGGDDGMSAVSDIIFATLCADATCNITLNMVDSYGDGWNGNAINVYQAGVEVGSGTIASGAAATETIEVCSTSPVEIRFTRGNYPDEMQGTVTDGGGNTVFTISGMENRQSGAVLATVATPCPACIAPMHIALDTASYGATTVTLSWNRGDANAWLVALGADTVNVTDTFYTFQNLTARTTYTAYVATDCSVDTSAYSPFTFTTDCANGSCNITITSTADYAYDNYCPTVHVYQNSSETASVNNATETVSVCSGIPVILIYEEPYYGSYDNPSVTVIDGAGTELFNGSTANLSDDDTLLTIANACPSCLTPTGVAATVIDSNNITFVWNELSDVSEYLISFNGDAYTTGSNGTESYSGLNPNTVYTFSVKAVCVPGVDTSAARTITVRTACGTMVLPYTNDFEAETLGNMPSCWNNTGATGTSYWSNYTYPAVTDDHANSGTKAIHFEGINGTSIIATGAVPLAGDSIYVAFWGAAVQGYSGTVSLEAGVMTNPAVDTTFIPLLTISGASDYALREFNTSSLTAYHDSTFHIAFRYVSNDTYSSADIDDINIRLDEGCMYPTNIVATPNTNDIGLTWSANGTSGTFAIEYHSANDDWSAAQTTTDTSFSITGLSAATLYEIRVGFICNTDTLWTIASAQTLCAPLGLPYSENFDAYAENVMPPCWSFANPNGVTHYDGGCFFRSNNGGGANYAVLPQLVGDITKYKVEFDAKVGTIAENDGILIGVADANGTLLGWLDTIQDPNYSRASHVRKTIFFINYNIPSGAERVVFGQFRDWNEWALIDNIFIHELPSCFPVDNVVGHNLIDPEASTFSWTPMGDASQWQVYVDTATVSIDSLYTMPSSNFTTVTDTFYTIPVGILQGGGVYNFFVRSDCGYSQSNWVKTEFGAGTVIMNNNPVADTVEGCGFVVYDNGGPIAGYLGNSNSALVVRSADAGSQLEVFGGKFGFGMDPATLTIYDGEGTTGAVLYTYNTVNGRDTLLNTILATSSTGALTITFTSGAMCHTGYELYIRCNNGASCPRPTGLQAQMTDETTATATWNGSAANYNFYYRLSGAASWTRQTVSTNSITLSNMATDTVYDMYVVALCSATDSSTASVVRQLRTTSTVAPTCDTVSNLQVISLSHNMAAITWTAPAGQNRWEVNYGDGLSVESTNPAYTFRNLTPSTQYNVKVRALCSDELFSEWSSTLTFTTEADPTGIASVDNSAIALFPNPASSTVTVSGLEGQATVTIVDMNGRVNGEWNVKSGNLTIDLTGYAQGAYFVRIVGEQQTAIRKLIVK